MTVEIKRSVNFEFIMVEVVSGDRKARAGTGDHRRVVENPEVMNNPLKRDFDLDHCEKIRKFHELLKAINMGSIPLESKPSDHLSIDFQFLTTITTVIIFKYTPNQTTKCSHPTPKSP